MVNCNLILDLGTMTSSVLGTVDTDDIVRFELVGCCLIQRLAIPPRLKRKALSPDVDFSNTRVFSFVKMNSTLLHVRGSTHMYRIE